MDSRIVQWWVDLQTAVSAMYDNSNAASGGASGFRQRLEHKEGLFRKKYDGMMFFVLLSLLCLRSCCLLTFCVLLRCVFHCVSKSHLYVCVCNNRANALTLLRVRLSLPIRSWRHTRLAYVPIYLFLSFFFFLFPYRTAASFYSLF